jgi:hypothetical protein
MQNRPLKIVARSSACCLLLFAAWNAVASEVLADSGAQLSSPGRAEVVRIAGEDPSAPNKSWGETVQPSAPPDSPPAVILDQRNGQGILGSAVRSAANEDMGRIVDVVVDRTGTARAAVIDFGGFLGVGSRKIAIDWNAMRFASLNRITIDMTRDQVKAAPEYEAGKPITVLGASAQFARSRVTARMPER